MKKSYLAIIFTILIFMTGCNNVEELQPVSEPEVEEMTDFIKQYREEVAKAFNQYNFSIVEDYFVPNTHYYHYQRKQIQQNRAQRIVEDVKDIDVVDVKKDQNNDYHIFTVEKVHTRDPRVDDQTEVIEQFYIVMTYRGEPKVIDKHRVNQN